MNTIVFRQETEITQPCIVPKSSKIRNVKIEKLLIFQGKVLATFLCTLSHTSKLQKIFGRGYKKANNFVIGDYRIVIKKTKVRLRSDFGNSDEFLLYPGSVILDHTIISGCESYAAIFVVYKDLFGLPTLTDAVEDLARKLDISKNTDVSPELLDNHNYQKLATTGYVNAILNYECTPAVQEVTLW